jgi:iron complex outermembrane receptor protein
MKIGFHRCRRALVAALGLALAMPAAAFAQDTGRITGRVVAAQTQRPVVSAQVFVEGLRLGALADAQGRFTIPNVPAGAHNVRVETIGFAASTKSVTVAAGEAATVDFSLEETAVALEELVVTGTAVGCARARSATRWTR